jgi:hypothetical protein
LGDRAFLKDYVKGKSPAVVRKLSRESLMPLYLFAGNDGVDSVDTFGLSSEPAVVWAPAPCPPPLLTAYVQVAVGYYFNSAPHVDNGSIGGNSDSSTGCPLYPVPLGNAFSDDPGGIGTGGITFTVCRVCLAKCSCMINRPHQSGPAALPGYKIVSVGPCVTWKTGDKGNLGSEVGTPLQGPNQNWQVGMDTDFSSASSGGCFQCRAPIQ